MVARTFATHTHGTVVPRPTVAGHLHVVGKPTERSSPNVGGLRGRHGRVPGHRQSRSPSDAEHQLRSETRCVPGGIAVRVEMNKRVIARWNVHHQLPRQQKPATAITQTTATWMPHNDRAAVTGKTTICKAQTNADEHAHGRSPLRMLAQPEAALR